MYCHAVAAFIREFKVSPFVWWESKVRFYWNKIYCSNLKNAEKSLNALLKSNYYFTNQPKIKDILKNLIHREMVKKIVGRLRFSAVEWQSTDVFFSVRHCSYSWLSSYQGDRRSPLSGLLHQGFKTNICPPPFVITMF